MSPRLQPVYASINRPLTIGGADRRLFFVALMVGGATFTLFGSLLAGLLMFLALFLGARWATQRDPQHANESLREIMKMISDGKLHPDVSAKFPLAEAGKSIRMLMDRKAMGKVVVTMG